MADFSQQYHPFLLDSDCSPSSLIKMLGFVDEPNNDTTSFSHFYQPETLQDSPADVNILESSSCVNQRTKVFHSNNKTSVTNKTNTDSHLMTYKVESSERVSQQVTPLDKKRKNKEGSSMSSAQTESIRDVKGKKQKKSNAVMKASKEKNPGNFKNDEKKASEEAPIDYIHVRARRGQATDRHSLAERVRRGKINERMKRLQAIVPGCDKVIGKALMLDAIINYVQFLQHQVEFLSTKLGSVNRMFYDFGMDVDAFMAGTGQDMNIQSLNALASPPPSMQPCNPTLPLVTDGTNNYYFQDISASLLFQQGPIPNTSSQGNGQPL